MPPNPRRFFLSHATSDSELAAFLETVLREVIENVEIFRTSRAGQLTAGQGWFEEIRTNLMIADGYVVLVTPRSHDRWWVMFEAGAAVRSGKTFVPMLAGGLTPSKVNEPLKYLTLREIEQPAGARQAFTDLGGNLPDPGSFVSQVTKLAEAGRVADAKRAGFEYIEYAGETYAWKGPLPELLDKIGSAPEPQGLPDALTAHGLQVTHGLAQDLREGAQGFSLVYLIDNWRYKRPVARGTDYQVLWVRPTNDGSAPQPLPVEIPWRGVEVDGRYFAWEGPILHSLTDWPPILAPQPTIDAIRRAGHTPSFGTRQKLRNHLADGAMVVYETDRHSWRKELLHAGDGSQVLLVREGKSPS